MRHDEGEKAYIFKSPARTLKFNHQQHLALGNVAPALAAAVDSGTYLSATRPAEISWKPRMPARPVIAAWQKAMPPVRATIRKWPTVSCVTRPSIRRSVASCAIQQMPRSNR